MRERSREQGGSMKWHAGHRHNNKASLLKGVGTDGAGREIGEGMEERDRRGVWEKG